MQLQITTNRLRITQCSGDEEQWIFRLLKPKGIQNYFSLHASKDYILDNYEDKAVQIVYI